MTWLAPSRWSTKRKRSISAARYRTCDRSSPGGQGFSSLLGASAKRFAGVESEGLKPEGELKYLREYHHVTLARVLIARGRAEQDPEALRQADRLLARLHESAEAGGRGGAVIETSILRALTTEALGDVAGALGHLDAAFHLAASEGYIRIFLDEGMPMRDLLRHAVGQGVGGDYARPLLAEFGEGAPNSSKPVPAGIPGLAEPLPPGNSKSFVLSQQGCRTRP